MTLNELLSRLRAEEPESPLVFATAGGEIGGGYHVTELKRSMVKGIDCGGHRSEWVEASLQLLDGSGGDHMKVGKFVGILEQSLRGVDGLGDPPARVEFAPGNAGLGLYTIGAPRSKGGRTVVRLTEDRAVCKPAQLSNLARELAGCCGRGTAPSRCCA